MGKGYAAWGCAMLAAALLTGGLLIPRQSEQMPEEESILLAEPATESAATEPTKPEEPTVPPGNLRCIEALDGMDAGCIFAYDPLAREMICCSTGTADKLYPASITKLLTAWVALRFLSGDEIVTVGWELGLLEPGSSTAFLALDSRLTVEDLIRAMLLPSGNDAALVLAAAAGRRIAGDEKITAGEAVAEFVAELNRAAEALDLQNSHFENPHGCHSPEHYSCPADIARIAELVLEEPIMQRCMIRDRLSVTIASGQTHTWKNTNRLVQPGSPWYCPEALGMKTGYTEAAGYCLLAAFGEETPLVVGVFASSDSASRYENAVALYRAWLSEEPAVQVTALHGEIQGRAGEQQDNGLACCHIGGIDPESTADVN